MEDLRVVHGQAGTPLYRIWSSMKFKVRKGGVAMDETWARSYQAFYDYVKEALGSVEPDGRALRRIDTWQGFVPGNLRWSDAPGGPQGIRLPYGKEFKNLAQWAYTLGEPSQSRLRRKLEEADWDFEEMIFVARRDGNPLGWNLPAPLEKEKALTPAQKKSVADASLPQTKAATVSQPSPTPAAVKAAEPPRPQRPQRPDKKAQIVVKSPVAPAGFQADYCKSEEEEEAEAAQRAIMLIPPELRSPAQNVSVTDTSLPQTKTETAPKPKPVRKAQAIDFKSLDKPTQLPDGGIFTPLPPNLQEEASDSAEFFPADYWKNRPAE